MSVPLTLVADAVATVVGADSEPELVGDKTVVEPLVVIVGVPEVTGMGVLVEDAGETGTRVLVGDSAEDAAEDSVGTGTGVLVAVAVTAVDDAPVAAGVVVGVADAVVSSIGVTVVVPMRPPSRVGTAYGGSKSPNLPHALHGKAHDLTTSGATRLGSHRPSGAFVAISEGSSD